MKVEALINAGELLKERPYLKDSDTISWDKRAVDDSFRSLCILLKGNALPTKTLKLASKNTLPY